jgi:uncharacterized membrane protein YsdA (DUF1294 family)
MAREEQHELGERDDIFSATPDQSPKAARVLLSLAFAVLYLVPFAVLGIARASAMRHANIRLEHPGLWLSIFASGWWVFCYFTGRQLRYARFMQKARFALNVVIGLMCTALALYFVAGYGNQP